MLESSDAYQPLRASLKSRETRSSDESDLEKCFERCGDGKDVDDEDKIMDCQLDCVNDQIALGTSRSNIGPRGK